MGSKKRLQRSFYLKPALQIAKNLLGKVLVRKIGTNFLAGKIVETEAYLGPEDKASHAYQMRRTARNEAEYLEGGHIYIYLIYGMYWQLNIVAAKRGVPECVLIRALEPIDYQNFAFEKKQTGRGLKSLKNEMNSTNGPGKLCRWLRLDKSFYGEDLSQSRRLWVEDWGVVVNSAQIIETTRIGIEYAGPWSKKPWRFYMKGNPWVSHK